MIEKTLNEVVKTRLGYTTTKSINSFKGEGDIILAKPNNFTKEYFFVENAKTVIRSEFNKVDNHILRNKDVLLVNKGKSVATYMYNNEYGNYIVTSSFFVLTVIDTNLIPEYFYWYLSQETIKENIRSLIRGATVQTLSKRNLDSISVQIPPIEKQYEIIDFFSSIIEEKKVINQLKDNNDAINKLQSQKYINELLWKKN